MTRVFVTSVVVSAVALSLGLSNNLFAQGAAPDTKSTAKGATTTSATMRQIHVTAGRLIRASLDVLNDVAQRPLAIETGDPLIWIPTSKQVEKDAKLWAKEMSLMGALEPPKKSWIDTDMSHVQRWVELLNSELNCIPASDQTAMGERWSDMSAALSDLNKQFAELQSLTAGPKYENLKIAQSALNVRDAARKLQKLSVARR
jgi:hypothetical protein